MGFCQRILALFFVDFAKAIPSIVVAGFCRDGSSISGESFVIFFCSDVFMTL